MNISRTFEVPKGYARIYAALPYPIADKLARILQAQGRTVILVYSHYTHYAVYAKV